MSVQIGICEECGEVCAVHYVVDTEYEPFGSTYAPRFIERYLSECCKAETEDATPEDALRHVQKDLPEDMEGVRLTLAGNCIHIEGTDSGDDIHYEEVLEIELGEFYDYVRKTILRNQQEESR